MERKLGMDGTLAQFLTSQTNTTQTVEDSDGDYEPPCKQRAYEDVGKSEWVGILKTMFCDVLVSYILACLLLVAVSYNFQMEETNTTNYPFKQFPLPHTFKMLHILCEISLLAHFSSTFRFGQLCKWLTVKSELTNVKTWQRFHKFMWIICI